jgi:hypothetical protein
MHSLSTFGVRMSHGQPRTHKIHHRLYLREATTFPLIVFFAALHDNHIQMAFCPRTSKWESQNSHSWDSRDFGAHNFVYRPSIAMRSEAKSWPFSRAFQCYFACRLHVRKSSQFLTFNGRESNCWFDSRPFF